MIDAWVLNPCHILAEGGKTYIPTLCLHSLVMMSIIIVTKTLEYLLFPQVIEWNNKKVCKWYSDIYPMRKGSDQSVLTHKAVIESPWRESILKIIMFWDQRTFKISITLLVGYTHLYSIFVLLGQFPAFNIGASPLSWLWALQLLFTLYATLTLVC